MELSYRKITDITIELNSHLEDEVSDTLMTIVVKTVPWQTKL